VNAYICKSEMVKKKKINDAELNKASAIGMLKLSLFLGLLGCMEYSGEPEQ